MTALALASADTWIPSFGFDVCVRRGAEVYCRQRERSIRFLHASAVREVVRDPAEICVLSDDDTLVCASIPAAQGEVDLVRLSRADEMHRMSSVAEVVAGRDRIVLRDRDGEVAERVPLFIDGNGFVGSRGVPGVRHVRGISAGDGFACALVESGAVFCWGAGNAGQLGIGCCADALEPRQVDGINDGMRIVSAARHTCVERADHTFWCWGDPSLGRLGTGAGTPQTTPRLIDLGEPVVGAAAGWAHTCALTERHSVYCWGLGYDGETGDPRLAFPREEDDVVAAHRSRARPALVLEDARIERVEAADHRTCAIGRTVAWCWGNNDLSAIGGRSLAVTREGGRPLLFDAVFAEPRLVSLERVRTLLSEDPPSSPGSVDGPGTRHRCTLTIDGHVRCAGPNEFGQLGDGTRTNRSVPVEVVGVEHALGVVTGSAHTCAWTRAGRLLCWGNNDHSQLSESVEIDPSVPHPVRAQAHSDARSRGP